MKKFEPISRVVHAEFLKLSGINCTDKLVLAVIYGLDDNGCTASDLYIADQIGIPERQARRAITKLNSLGYVEVTCERGKGILGTKRVITCKILVKTTSQKRSVVPNHLPKTVSGFDQKRSVVLEVVQGEHMLQSAEISSDSIRDSNIIYNNIIAGEKHEAPFQVPQVPTPQVGSALLEKIKQVAKEKGLALGFGDRELADLEAFDKKSLVICAERACDHFSGTRLTWNYFVAVVKTNGVIKKPEIPALPKPKLKLAIL